MHKCTVVSLGWGTPDTWYHMQAVEDKWYLLYRWMAAGWASIFLVGSILSWTIPSLSGFQSSLGLNYVSGITSFLVIIYAVFYYDKIAKKSSHVDAMLIQAFIQALGLINVTQAAGGLGSIYAVAWVLMALLSGMFGLLGTGGVAFMTAFYYVLQTSRANGDSRYDMAATAAFIAILVASVISYYFWKRKYIDPDNVQIMQLTGQLKTTKQQSEILIQSISDGVMLIMPDNSISIMNPAAATMTGSTIEEAKNAQYSSVLKLQLDNGNPLEASEHPIILAMKSTIPINKTLQLTAKDNKTITISLAASPILDNGKTIGVVAVMRDVSTSYQEEKQRAEFISTASHEMRTPVAAIEGYLALAMNEKVSKIDPHARSYLEKAHESTTHLGKLFQDLLMSAKAEDGRLVSHPQPVEMGAYVEQLAESFKFSADKKGLLTDFTFGGGNQGGSVSTTVRPLYYVNVDPDRIREVVTNLFDNAVKYTPSGKVSLGLTGNDDVVQIYIKDTGPGIPATDLPHLFQKFYRVDNSATRTIGGTGLGLFICRKIVELYHGRIWVESQVGQGSTFYINLPRLTSERAAELATQIAQSQTPAPVTNLATPV